MIVPLQLENGIYRYLVYPELFAEPYRCDMKVRTRNHLDHLCDEHIEEPLLP